MKGNLKQYLINYPTLLPHLDKLKRVEKWVGLKKLSLLLADWSRPERYYHNIQHMTEMFEQFNPAELDINELEKDALACAIVYHDAVYDPRAKNPANEQDSIDMWVNHMREILTPEVEAHYVSDGFVDPKHGLIQAVTALIKATIDHTNITADITSKVEFKIAKMFIKWDLRSLCSDDLTVLIDAERRVLKEYQFYDYELYRAGRLAILEKMKPSIFEINPDSKIESLIQYVKARKLKVGIYAGSFFPMHAGHYSIIKRAEKVFDKVIIACGKNPAKSVTNVPELKIDFIDELKNEILKYHQVEAYDGLTTNYVQSKRTPYVEPSVIKGLGRPGDFEDEKMQMRYMEDMDPTINMAYFISDRRFDYVSSTGARIVKNINPDVYDKYVLGRWPDAEEKMKL